MTVTLAIVYLREGKRVEFAIAPSGELLRYKDQSCGEFCDRYGLIRQAPFDWAVGNAGKDCVLLLCENSAEFENQLTCQWVNFPMAAKAITNGNEKRLLQLAVQYLSTDGLDDQVGAAVMDEQLQELIRQQTSAITPD